MHKFDNPTRVAELCPAATLKNIGLKKQNVFCDIGAGTGLFTIEAAKISGNTTYAIDTSADMLDIIKDKCESQGINNIVRIKPAGFSYPLENGECDFVLMCTVFHEIDDKPSLLTEIHRILKPQGKLIIIEFFRRETPFGPPVSHRISKEHTKTITEQHSFALSASINLGENYYLAEFLKD